MVGSKLTVNVADCVKKHRKIMVEKLKKIREIDNNIDTLIACKIQIEMAFDDASDEMIKDYCKDHGLQYKAIKEIINPSR